MERRNRIIAVYGVWLADLVCIVVAYLLANYIRFGNFVDMEDKSVHILVCILFVLLSTMYGFFLDWNRDFLTRGYLQELWEVLRFNVLMVLVVGFFLFMIQKAEVFSRLVMGYFLILDVLIVYWAHLLLKKLMRSAFASERSVTKVMVIGYANQLEDLVGRLKGKLGFEYEIVSLGCLDDSVRPEKIAGIPVAGGGDSLLETCRQLPLDEVFIGSAEYPEEKKGRLIRGFEEMGVTCHYNLGIFDGTSTKGQVGNFGDFTVVTYSAFHSSYKRQLIKRLMDIAGGLAGSALTLVLMPFLAVAIKLDSPGPVFFKQKRVGIHKTHFWILKFRTMRSDTPHDMPTHLLADPDQYITRVGHFLRKTSLDELPQLWNILVGDMAVIGPRPALWNQYDLLAERDKYGANDVRPGLTGLAQIHGRDELEIPVKAKLDGDYVAHITFWGDVKLFFGTIGAVVRHDGVVEGGTGTLHQEEGKD